MPVTSAPVLGVSSERSWSQVFHKKQEQSETFLVCSLSDLDDAREHGRRFIEHLSQLRFENAETTSASLQALFSQKQFEHLSCAVITLFQDTAYVWCSGDAEIQIRRQEKIGTILKSYEFTARCGPMKKDDVYLLGTKGFFIQAPHVLSTPFQTVDELAVALIPQVQSSDVSAGYVIAYEEQQVLNPPMIDQIISVFHRILQYLPKLERTDTKRKKKLIIIGGFVATALILGLFFKISAMRNQGIAARLVAPYTQQLEKARSTYTSDKFAARTSMQQLIAEIQTRRDTSKKGSVEYNAFNTLLTSLKKYYDSISGEKTYETLPIFFDFRLVKSDFIAKKIRLDKNIAYFLDPEGQTIITLNLDSKQTTTLSFQISGAKDFALGDGMVYILATDGVYALPNTSSGTAKKIIDKQDSWKDPEFLDMFGGNLYMLDKDARQIVKFVGTTSTTFSPGVNWIRSAQGVDMSTIQSMHIDGQVWLTSSDGKIFLLSQGTRTGFSLKGVGQLPTGSILFYTDADIQNVAVVDLLGQRLFIASKTGELQQTIFAKNLSTATGVMLRELQHTVFIPAGSVVYEISL